MNLQQRWVVGRDETCDVQVTDEYASAQHCEVGLSVEGHYFIRDLGSTNGTFIRTSYMAGTSLQQVWGTWHRIFPGEALVVGRSEIPWARS